MMLADAIGAEFRQFLEGEHEGRPARVVRAVRSYCTHPADLWDAVTNRERLPEAVWAGRGRRGLGDEGKAFMRASAEAWARAHIAGGEDPATARGMAERTAAFYTGG